MYMWNKKAHSLSTKKTPECESKFQIPCLLEHISKSFRCPQTFGHLCKKGL